jgi:hypothetical protein
MDKRLTEHRKFIEDEIKTTENPRQLKKLQKYHSKMTQNFQAERLIHLIITLFFALFSMLLAITVVVTENLTFLILTGLVLALLVPYIFHYYKLENGVQSLYLLDRMLLDKQTDLEKNKQEI